ncbi:hypothetical protein VIGAN_02185000 [Vigna angularis var. angularis]|uniref:Uncharacterized protein n=1 Tax=Vigna angularis var. angularis TaxID=157739 RepID=A0A0S3REC8_PHAAN|nr:hypothetical protein VIGAN_02185000 [Vigna angularis var. angularis]
MQDAAVKEEKPCGKRESWNVWSSHPRRSLLVCNPAAWKKLFGPAMKLKKGSMFSSLVHSDMEHLENESGRSRGRTCEHHFMEGPSHSFLACF